MVRTELKIDKPDINGCDRNMRNQIAEYSSKRVALVTGGGRGIGKAVALALWEEGNIVISNQKTLPCDMNHGKPQELFRVKRNFYVVQADVSHEDEVRSMMRNIKEKFGGVHILINNAGMIDASKDDTLETVDWDNFHLSMGVNFFGSVLVTKYALPLLRMSAGAKIVYILSSSSFVGSKRRFSYISSKTALIGLVRSLTLELSPDILVNAVVPGYIDTRMAVFTEHELQERLKRIPLGRLGRVEEVAHLICFLSSDRNTYMTGQCVHIDGGLYMS